MNERYDLIIIGAGPAGLMAALSAVKRGISVLLLEKDDKVGIPLNCAEAVAITSFERLVTPKASCPEATVAALPGAKRSSGPFSSRTFPNLEFGCLHPNFAASGP